MRQHFMQHGTRQQFCSNVGISPNGSLIAAAVGKIQHPVCASIHGKDKRIRASPSRRNHDHSLKIPKVNLLNPLISLNPHKRPTVGRPPYRDTWIGNSASPVACCAVKSARRIK
jgi:hypothetical protein